MRRSKTGYCKRMTEVDFSLEVSSWAELERPLTFDADDDLTPDALILDIVQKSAYYLACDGPNPVEVITVVTLGREFVAEAFLEKGQARIEIVHKKYSLPWVACHELAHLLAFGEGHSRRWLVHYRNLILERYGVAAADLLDHDSAVGWLRTEGILP